MINIVIFGAPGSGKGTQSERIIKEYGLFHISTGDVLRSQIAQGTELGKIAETYISKGKLIPDELMIDILEDVLDHADTSRGIILDGFPRTIPQADALDRLFVKHNMHLDRGKTSGRSDDNLETIHKRLDVYRTQTNPLRDHYIEQHKYVAIYGMGSVDEIFERIKGAIAAI